MRSSLAWRYAAARNTGTGHKATNTPCQDSAACFAEAPGTLVMAVSDGAGSAPRADVASALAVAAASDFLRHQVRRPDLAWPDALRAAARAAQGALVMEAGRHGLPLHHYACTLLLLALTPEGGGALQIGDGVMVIRADGAPWQHIFWPQKGEFVNTTRFVTDADAEDAWEYADLPATLTDIAAMTDGLEALALQFAGKTVHTGFFDGIIRPLAAASGAGEKTEVAAGLQAFLESPRVTCRTDDDLTLVVATRSAAP